jgi:DUF1707 SHOCT-like domain
VPAGWPPASEPSGPGAWQEQRASDADRDRVVNVFRAAVGDGRLTIAELDQRVEAALSARTLGDLAALTTDLGAPARPLAADARAQDLLRIRQRGGSVQRSGRWVVPRRLELRSSWSDVTLDFTDAVITHDTFLIELKMRGGSLVLVTGPGIVVDAHALTVRYTDVTVGPEPGPGAPVTLQVRVTGSTHYGRIETRWPG